MNQRPPSESVANRRVIDLFAGPGGWDEGAATLGMETIGLEIDEAACLTAHRAGHARIRADVATYPTAHLAGKVAGLIASPPCPDWSTAGSMKREAGKSGALVSEVMRWAIDVQPDWIACEQVPQVIHVWKVYAGQLRTLGYNVWTGTLDAADYGLAQNRQRAVLLASRTRTVAPPAPTHGADTGDRLFGEQLEPHRTLAEVLGLPAGCVYDSGQNSRAAGGTTERYIRSCDRPSGTVTGKTTSQWVLRGAPNRRKVTLTESAALQGFRPDYPWQGRTEDVLQQIGNAVPPPFAARLLATVSGYGVQEVAA